MTKPIYSFLCCALIGVSLPRVCRAGDFGVSQTIFDQKQLHTVFTFRDGVLIHELTSFFDPESKIPGKWVEQFFDESQAVFVRVGGHKLYWERYTGASRAGVLRGSRGGDETGPVSLCIGRETFTMGDDGHYRVIADKESILHQSVLFEPAWSTSELNDERQKLLHQSQSQK